jgi:hypothetical protein
MTDKITFKAFVAPGATPYYGILKISDIQHADGSPIKVQKTLNIAFKTPVAVNGNQDLNLRLDPWVEITPTTINNQIDSSTFAVDAKLPFPEPYTINDRFVIDISINGDMTTDIKRYTESIVITQDSE